MGRRYRRRNDLRGIIAFYLIALASIVYVIGKIIEFISQNSEVFLTIFLLIVIGFIIYYSFRLVNYKKNVKEYNMGNYFTLTGIPYRKIKKNKGQYFEAVVYNRLSEEFQNDTKILVNLVIPRKGSINEYSEVDMLMFHSSGVYCLELKNISGYIYGNINSENWNIGYKREDKKNKRTTREVFELYNPIHQNNQHIEDLKKIYNHEYINYVIFSDETKLESHIDNVCYLDEFISIVKSKDNKYSELNLNDVYDTIYNSNRPDKITEHIERIKFNTRKYNK